MSQTEREISHASAFIHLSQLVRPPGGRLRKHPHSVDRNLSTTTSTSVDCHNFDGGRHRLRVLDAFSRQFLGALWSVVGVATTAVTPTSSSLTTPAVPPPPPTPFYFRMWFSCINYPHRRRSSCSHQSVATLTQTFSIQFGFLLPPFCLIPFSGFSIFYFLFFYFQFVIFAVGRLVPKYLRSIRWCWGRPRGGAAEVSPRRRRLDAIDQSAPDLTIPNWDQILEQLGQNLTKNWLKMRQKLVWKFGKKIWSETRQKSIQIWVKNVFKNWLKIGQNLVTNSPKIKNVEWAK